MTKLLLPQFHMIWWEKYIFGDTSEAVPSERLKNKGPGLKPLLFGFWSGASRPLLPPKKAKAEAGPSAALQDDKFYLFSPPIRALHPTHIGLKTI
jgi:hypothetical protein